MKYKKNDVAIKSGEKDLGNVKKPWKKNVQRIEHLETRFKVIGSFEVVGGLLEFALALVNPFVGYRRTKNLLQYNTIDDR